MLVINMAYNISLAELSQQDQATLQDEFLDYIENFADLSKDDVDYVELWQDGTLIISSNRQRRTEQEFQARIFFTDEATASGKVILSIDLLTEAIADPGTQRFKSSVSSNSGDITSVDSAEPLETTTAASKAPSTPSTDNSLSASAIAAIACVGSVSFIIISVVVYDTVKSKDSVLHAGFTYFSL